jgi:hypothetical protein
VSTGTVSEHKLTDDDHEREFSATARAGAPECARVIPETDRIHMVLFGMPTRTLGPYLAAINKIVISIVNVQARSASQLCRR